MFVTPVCGTPLPTDSRKSKEKLQTQHRYLPIIIILWLCLINKVFSYTYTYIYINTYTHFASTLLLNSKIYKYNYIESISISIYLQYNLINFILHTRALPGYVVVFNLRFLLLFVPDRTTLKTRDVGRPVLSPLQCFRRLVALNISLALSGGPHSP